MQGDSLCKLLNKFKKDELLELLSERGYLDGSSRERTGTKAAIVGRVLKRLENKLSEREIAELDLNYQQNHPSRKEWSVFLLVEFDAEKARGRRLSDPKVLENKLHNSLQHFFNMSICVQSWKGALWIRLVIHERQNKSSSSSTVYLVHYPLSPYVMTTSIKAAYKQYVFQALFEAMGCNNIQKLDLTGKDVQSLADMVLNRRSQGKYSEYRLNQVDDNPLLQGISLAKRKKQNQDETANVGVADENKMDNEKMRKWLDNAFGSKNKQPVLEKVKFTMQTNFKGTTDLDFNKNTFLCSIKFEGQSVIEGIKNLGQEGIADLPLPSHLANLHSSSRNHFTLTNRKRPRQTDLTQD